MPCYAVRTLQQEEIANAAARAELRGERVGKSFQGRLGEDERRENPLAGRGVGYFLGVGILVVATGRCVSTFMLEMMMVVDWRTYPLPSSLALREKMIAKENMIAEENIFAEMGIDVGIRIIVVVVSVVCAQVYGRMKSKR